MQNSKIVQRRPDFDYTDLDGRKQIIDFLRLFSGLVDECRGSGVLAHSKIYCLSSNIINGDLLLNQ